MHNLQMLLLINEKSCFQNLTIHLSNVFLWMTRRHLEINKNIIRNFIKGIITRLFVQI